MTTERTPEVLTAAIEFPCDWCDKDIREGSKYAVHIANRTMSYVHYPWCYDDAEHMWQDTLSHA